MRSPQFIVEMSSYARPEREYVLSVLLRDWLGISYVTEVVGDRHDVRIRRSSGGAHVLVLRDHLLSPDVAWLSEESLPRTPLATVDLPQWTREDDRLPVLYSASHDGQVVERDGDVWTLHLDLLGTAYFLLTQYEERVLANVRDAHGRFPASASVLSAGDWLEWPVLDMSVRLLGSILNAIWPGVAAEPAHEGVLLSHDIDHPSSSGLYSGARSRLRVISADIARRRDASLAARRALSFLGPPGLLSMDPYNTFDFLMTSSERAGVRSTFFLMADLTHLPHGSAYRLSERWVEPLLTRIATRNHRIGLHASYESAVDREQLTREWHLLRDACPPPINAALMPAVRQHYLRWDALRTWPAQAAAGLRIDHSLGYADAVGFRAGTARRFRAFDVGMRKPLDLWEEPLAVMDGTIHYYMRLGSDDAVNRVVRMNQRVRRFGGGLSILWHNSSLETRSARRSYSDLVAAVTG